jgi:hypothetical protein
LLGRGFQRSIVRTFPLARSGEGTKPELTRRDVKGGAFRAIADDDLLRFLSAYQAVGMLR